MGSGPFFVGVAAEASVGSLASHEGFDQPAGENGGRVGGNWLAEDVALCEEPNGRLRGIEEPGDRRFDLDRSRRNRFFVHGDASHSTGPFASFVSAIPT